MHPITIRPLSSAPDRRGRRLPGFASRPGTALVERAHVGGTCINEGVPLKTMVAAAVLRYLARRGDYGIHTGNIAVDRNCVRERKRDIVASFRDGSQARIEKTPGLDLLFGEASFTGPRSIQVLLPDGSQRTLTSDKFFINAGCRPFVPSLPGLQDIPYLNSTSIMELEAVPDRLLVIGGGYIGLEFGQLFRRFGGHVTIFQQASQLLRGEVPMSPPKS